MDAKIKGVKICVSKDRNTEDTDGSTLEETLNDLILKKVGRVLKQDVKTTPEENQQEEQQGVIETNKGETSYSLNRKKGDTKKRRMDGDEKGEEEKGKEKIRKLLSSEAAKRATVRRAQAYEDADEERIDSEPPRRTFKAEEQATVATERRNRLKTVLEGLKTNNMEIHEGEDKEEHKREIERCLVRTQLNNANNGDFLENRSKARKL